MNYKQPKPKKTKPVATAKKPSLANTILSRATGSFGPLTPFQKALFYRGFKKKPSPFSKWANRNAGSIAIIEKTIFIAFVIFALFTNAFLLLILPAIGAVIFYRVRLKFLWWKLKVFVLKRNYYQHRRELYKQGSLLHHLNHKLPKHYGKALIWGQSESIQDTIFRRLQKNNQLTKKEYIKL